MTPYADHQEATWGALFINLRELVLTNDNGTAKSLEGMLGLTRAEAVDMLIRVLPWPDGLRQEFINPKVPLSGRVEWLRKALPLLRPDEAQDVFCAPEPT